MSFNQHLQVWSRIQHIRKEKKLSAMDPFINVFLDWYDEQGLNRTNEVTVTVNRENIFIRYVRNPEILSKIIERHNIAHNDQIGATVTIRFFNNVLGRFIFHLLSENEAARMHNLIEVLRGAEPDSGNSSIGTTPESSASGSSSD